MTEHAYPDPHIAPEDETYWRAADNGKLLIKECRDCGKPHFYPRKFCPFCHSKCTEWKEAAGTGRIYSYSVMRRADPPYALAYVRLTEGVTILTNIVEADLDELEVEMPVEVKFYKTNSGQALAVFRPTNSLPGP